MHGSREEAWAGFIDAAILGCLADHGTVTPEDVLAICDRLMIRRTAVERAMQRLVEGQERSREAA